MKIDIISFPVCQQCSMIKKILKKYNLVFQVNENDIPSLDEYPLITINNKEFDYHGFLKFVKEGGLNELSSL